MGSLQAAETIDLILGKGTPLIGRLLLFNALHMNFKELKLRKNPSCSVCGPNPTVKRLIDYEAFCGVQEELNPEHEITVKTLKKLLDEKADVTILDVGAF